MACFFVRGSCDLIRFGLIVWHLRVWWNPAVVGSKIEIWEAHVIGKSAVFRDNHGRPGS